MGRIAEQIGTHFRFFAPKRWPCCSSGKHKKDKALSAMGYRQFHLRNLKRSCFTRRVSCGRLTFEYMKMRQAKPLFLDSFPVLPHRFPLLGLRLILSTSQADPMFTNYIPIAQSHHHTYVHLAARRHLPCGVHLSATSHKTAPATCPARCPPWPIPSSTLL
jgi:hypothetical protein